MTIKTIPGFTGAMREACAAFADAREHSAKTQKAANELYAQQTGDGGRALSDAFCDHAADVAAGIAAAIRAMPAAPPAIMPTIEAIAEQICCQGGCVFADSPGMCMGSSQNERATAVLALFENAASLSAKTEGGA